jgi:hypothetical protein
MNIANLGKTLEQHLSLEVREDIVLDNYAMYVKSISMAKSGITGLISLMETRSIKKYPVCTAWIADLKEFLAYITKSNKDSLPEFNGKLTKEFLDKYEQFKKSKYIKFCSVVCYELKNYEIKYKDEFLSFKWLDKTTPNTKVILLDKVSKVCCKYLWDSCDVKENPVYRTKLAVILRLVYESFRNIHLFAIKLEIDKTVLYDQINRALEMINTKSPLKDRINKVTEYIQENALQIIRNLDSIHRDTISMGDSSGYIFGIFDCLRGNIKNEKMSIIEKKRLSLEFRLLNDYMAKSVKTQKTSKPNSNSAKEKASVDFVKTVTQSMKTDDNLTNMAKSMAAGLKPDMKSDMKSDMKVTTDSTQIEFTEEEQKLLGANHLQEDTTEIKQ